METILYILLGLVIGIILGTIYGWGLRERYATHQLDKLLDKVEKNKEESIRITIEKHKDTFYVYNKEDNQFMAQGNSREEIEEVLKDKFPGKKFACDEKTLTEMGFLS